MLQNAGVLYILTYKYASRHSGVQFFDIWSSKSGPHPSVFSHFDWKMCFGPHRRAIFEHRNFKNGSETVLFCAFWLANVLRATAACHFWTSELPKIFRPCGVLCILTWKRRAIFEHQNVQNWSEHAVFCAFWLENALHATAPCHFSSVCWTATSAPAALARLLFEHQEPLTIGKTQRFATSLTFRERVPAFYWLYTRVYLLSADLTSLLWLTPLLCFSTLHIVGS